MIFLPGTILKDVINMTLSQIKYSLVPSASTRQIINLLGDYGNRVIHIKL